MEGAIERAYKRKCFQGRGTVARLLDRAFFSALGGACLYIVLRQALLSILLFAALFLLLNALGRIRWQKYRKQLWRSAASELKRENWLKQEAERLRQQGGVILIPSPERDELVGLCLRMGTGTSFHAFGGQQEELTTAADDMGCTVTFHPWGEGETPAREQIEARIRQEAPLRQRSLWKQLVKLSDSRYLMTGSVLLLLSIFVKGALYWRLLASLCLLIGAIRRTIHMAAET